MRRLGIIGLETTHGFIYPALMNGYDPERLVANSIPMVSGIFPTKGAPSVEGVQIVACYDPDPERARLVAEACLIERVCSSAADVLKDVDGVLICNGDSRAHRGLATLTLEAGVPTFLDKPFTESIEDAEALIALSESRNTPLFCTSALRFGPQVVALRERLPETVGELVTAHAIGTGDWDAYAIHTLETLLTVWGSGIREIQSIGAIGHDTIQMTDRSGRRLIWQVCIDMAWIFHISVYGSKGMDQAFIPRSDRYVLFKGAAERISTFMHTRETPVPLRDTLELVRILDLARANRGTMMPVDVAG